MVEIFGHKIDYECDISGLINHVSPERRRQISRFAHIQVVRQSLMGDLLIRAVACRRLNAVNSTLVFKTTPYGKPYLSGVRDFHYNLSHSGQWVVCAISHEPVGIDVEEIQAVDMDIVRAVFSGEEIGYLEKTPQPDLVSRFYDLWSLKESYVKALGHGASIPLDSFTVNLSGNQVAVTGSGYQSRPVFLRKYNLARDYRLAVCAFQDEFPDDITLVDLNWITDSLNSW